MKKLYFTFCLLATLCSCVEESPLSEQDVSDPKLILPEIKLIRSINNVGLLEDKLEVTLFDNNEQGIDLKTGSVKLNGKSLSVTKDDFSNTPYYTSNDFSLDPKKEYEIDIKLADGKSYSASIFSPNVNELEFNVPTSHNKKYDMYISWNGVKDLDYDELKLEINNNYIDVEGETEYKIKKGKISSYLKDWGESEENENNKINIVLTLLKNGNVSSDFAGGNITATHSISRTVVIDEISIENNDPSTYTKIKTTKSPESSDSFLGDAIGEIFTTLFTYIFYGILAVIGVIIFFIILARRRRK